MHKKIIVVVLLVILPMIPFIMFFKNVEKACDELSAKSEPQTIEDIINYAENKGLSVGLINEEKFLFIYDKKTLGKFTCNIRYDGDKIIYKYSVS